MQLRTLLVLAVAAIASIGAVTIDHDKVQPFPQPEPTTASEKAAITFKPSLVIKSGCHPYPAVNAAGETSAGLKPTGRRAGDCEGSALGSQIYSRSMLYSGKWAIMYAWYFPKEISSFFPSGREGLRHRWYSMIVWLDDVAKGNPTVLASSTPSANGLRGTRVYSINKPVSSENIDDATLKMEYAMDFMTGSLTVRPSTEVGDFQDLIQWEQLTDEAREALETTSFGEFNEVPFNDALFESSLEAGSTISVYRLERHGGSYRYSIWDEQASNATGI